jgi:two-component system NtrC family sensor kinase
MTNAPSRGLRSALTTPGLALGALLLISIAIAAGAPLALASRNLSRVSLVRNELVATAQLQQLTLQLQGSLVSDLSGSTVANLLMVDALRAALADLQALDLPMDPQTSDRVEQLRAILRGTDLAPTQVLVAGLTLVEDIAAARYGSQAALLREIQENAVNERRLALWTLGALVLIVALGAWWIPRRLVRPLGEMTELLGRVAEGRTEPVADADRHPLTAPVFRSYNGLVRRLRELEEEHRDRESSLERDVARVRRALLEQHRTLAEAERMAVVGTTAAGLAHDLRNPLAGVLAGLDNLRAETGDEDTGRRVDLLSSELRRAVDLLNGYLASARHTPEPQRPTDVGALVSELVELVGGRAEGVDIRIDAPDDLVCVLPRDRVRQALLNLILNGVDATRGTGTSVWVRAEHDGDWLDLTVSDDGPGFPADFTAASIRPFASSRPEGTGLGLAMVRRTVRDLGGNLEISNREEGGARVLVRIPWRQA